MVTKIYLTPSIASSIVCSKAVVLLFYSLFFVTPIVCGALLLDTCFVLQ